MTDFPRAPPRAAYSERERTQFLLGDFRAQGSEGLKFLESLCPFALTRSALISLATVLSELINVPLDRDIKRKKELLIKWFDVNIDAVRPWGHKIRLDISTYGDVLQEENRKSQDGKKLATEDNNQPEERASEIASLGEFDFMDDFFRDITFCDDGVASSVVGYRH